MSSPTTKPNTPDAGAQPLVRVGDIIRFGYQGRSYMLLGNISPPTTVGAVPSLVNTADEPKHRWPTSFLDWVHGFCRDLGHTRTDTLLSLGHRRLVGYAGPCRN